MPDPYATLLLTRPQAASLRFAQDLGADVANSLAIVVSPLLDIVAVASDHVAQDYEGVIFTSANGVLHGGAAASCPTYCVGVETTRIAVQHGWDAQQIGGTAQGLIEALIQRKPPVPLLHIAGAHRRGQVAERLSEAGLRTDDATVYDQIAQPFTAQAIAALSGQRPVIVPLFSPRTARLFAQKNHATAPLHLVAMSRNVMDELDAVTAQSRTVASAPDASAMKEAVSQVLRRVEAGDAPL